MAKAAPTTPIPTPGNLWPIARDEGNPSHIGTVAWQRRKHINALRRATKGGKVIEYSPTKELKQMYRHYRAFEAARISRYMSNPEDEMDSVLLIALELYTALPHLTYARRIPFEACIIGRQRLPNLYTHKWEWKWMQAPMTVPACADMLETNARYVNNLIERALDTLVGRIYAPFDGL